MDARNNDFDFDFTPIGQAIKKARTSRGMARDELARIVDYNPRHLQAIENEGQKPSLELLDRKPMILVLAGPNGSGKSTITQYFDKVGSYTNADDVVATIGISNEKVAILKENNL